MYGISLESVISALGLNLTSSALWDILRICFQSGQKQDKQHFTEKLHESLKSHGNNVDVCRAIRLLESKGLISTSQSTVISYSLKPGFGGARYYGDSLDEKHMRAAYHELEFEQIEYLNELLPYTIELPFFDIGNNRQHFSFKEITCRYNKTDDLTITRREHCLDKINAPLFSKELRKAYTNRNWSQIEEWLDYENESHSRPLLRFSGIDKERGIITWAKTDYNTQAVSNLVADMSVEKKSIRLLSKENYYLPNLNSRILANNLGISVLMIDEDGFPVIPLRNNKGVAIFPDEWGCTNSTASRLPEGCFEGYNNEVNLGKLISHAVENMFLEEFKLNEVLMGNLIPLALCREWFRAGKPQLFFALPTTFFKNEIEDRLSSAEHSKELVEAKTRFIERIRFKNKLELYDFKRTDKEGSIELLANIVLWNLYKNTNNRP